MESILFSRSSVFLVCLCLAILIGVTLPITCRAQIEARELPTRPGVTIRFVYARAAVPIVNAILFQGGEGNVGVHPDGSVRSSGFLAAGAQRFINEGVTVAIVDVPSDRRSLDQFRASAEHATDAMAVVPFLREQNHQPVWVVGTSAGSLSAASIAAMRIENGPDGVVLTSSVTTASRFGINRVTLAPLENIDKPVLFVHHKEDGCRSTPYADIPAVQARLIHAPKIELITVEGGLIRGDPCRSGHHQYLGIEEQVTQQIAQWIKEQSVNGNPAR